MKDWNNPAVSVRYLANCGVLLQKDGVGVLVDGLCSDSSAFGRLPAAAEDRLIRGNDPDWPVDLLAFTHLHSDHFDLEKTLRFLESHREAVLLCPPSFQDALKTHVSKKTEDPETPEGPEIPGISGAESILRGRAAFMETAELETKPEGNEIPPGFFRRRGIELRYVQTDHISLDDPKRIEPQPFGLPHFCLLLSLGLRDFLFTSDMDFSDLPQLAEALNLRGRPCLTAFFNPILLARREWVSEVTSWNPRQVFLYHLPPEDADPRGYRSLAVKRAARYKDLLPQLSLLMKPLQSLEIL